MPRYCILFRNCPALIVEDDANAKDLGERLAAAQKEGRRFVTSFLDPLDESEVKKAAARGEPLPEPEVIVSASMDAADVIHIFSDEVEFAVTRVQADEPSDEDDEDEDDEGRPAVVNPRMFGKKK